MMKTYPLLLLLFVGATHLTRAQVIKPSAAKNQAEIDRIKDHEQEVNYSVLSRLPTLRQVVKDSPTGSWHEVKSGSDRFAWHFLQADVGTHKGGLAHISMRHSATASERPDSSILLFRPDGTLAKYILVIETWTNGKLTKSTGRIQYFNKDGDVLLTVSASKDNKTGKITAAPKFSRPLLPIYKRTTDLPFYNLLKMRLRTSAGKPVV